MTEFIHSYETKLSSIDETFMSLQRNRVKIEEEKKVLEAKSDQLNPKKSKEVSETVRYVCEITCILANILQNSITIGNYTCTVHVFLKSESVTGEVIILIKHLCIKACYLAILYKN